MAITAAMVKELRETTGVGMLDCKKALAETNGDMEKAVEYLREKGEKDIIVVGLQTDKCIDATIKCGFEHGLNMIVPSYANSTVDNDFFSGEQSYKYYNEFMWNDRYAKCISINKVFNMLER